MSSPPRRSLRGSLTAQPRRPGGRGHRRGLRARAARSRAAGRPTRTSARSSAIDDRRGHVDGRHLAGARRPRPGAGRPGWARSTPSSTWPLDTVARRATAGERRELQRARHPDRAHRGGRGRRTPGGALHVGDGLRRAAATTRCRWPRTRRCARCPTAACSRDLLEIERLAAQAPRSHPGLQVTVLRPADGGRARHRQRADPALRGAAAAGRARLAAALAVLPRRRPGGRARARRAGPGDRRRSPSAATAGWSRTRSSWSPGMRRIELPASLAFGTAERLHRLGRDPGAGERPAVRRAPVGGALDPAARGRLATGVRQRRRRSGCCSSRSAATTRSPPGGSAGADATIGAAGAAVAVVGTAALVRAARRKRR